MRAGSGWRTLSFLALATTPVLSGCLAAVPVVASGAGSGISYTSTTAYRSFTYPKAQVHAAALQALERMQIQKTKDERNGEPVRIEGRTEHLKIYITLAPITPTVTKVSINAKKNWFMKDQTVAVEILSQMDQALGRADPARSPAEEVR